MSVRYFIYIFFFIFFLESECISQTDTYSVSGTDSINEYYTDLSDLLAIKAQLLFKLSTIEIINNDQRIRLQPNSPIAIGFGFNYAGIGLTLGFGLPHTSSNINKYGKTNRFDIQASLYTKKIGGDAYFQLYKGYFNSNPEDFINSEKLYYPKLPEMQTISFGANIYYILNNKRFSNKAAYSRTQVQNKSAGTVTIGYFLNYDESDSPGGFIPSEYPDSIASDFDIQSFRYFATGISIGYMYTWVISKKFFLNASAIPGFGYKDIKITDGNGENALEQQPHGQILIRGALGYESRYFYAGLTGMTLIRNITFKDYKIDLATEQVRFFIGKRFNIKKRKKSPD